MRLRLLMVFTLISVAGVAQHTKTELSVQYGSYTQAQDFQISKDVRNHLNLEVDANHAWFLTPAPTNSYEIYALKQHRRRQFRSRLSYGLMAAVSFNQQSFLLTRSEHIDHSEEVDNNLVQTVSFDNTAFTLVNHRLHIGPTLLYRWQASNRIRMYSSATMTANVAVRNGLQRNQYTGMLRRTIRHDEVVREERLSASDLSQRWIGLEHNLRMQAMLQLGGEWQLAEARPYYLKCAYTLGQIISFDEVQVKTFQGVNVGVLSVF